VPAEPVVPKPAATVLLLRDHPDPPAGRAPLQVFLQRRVSGMAFAGGMTVFPGGGVDATDRPDAALWAGPGPDW
jgi:8-oxo-dGTP pyrophosphatase MutT (NUDIX family)